MMAPRKIRTKVIVVDAPQTSAATAERGSEPRFRPSDLLPWADPYIAGLVNKLQQEVRQEEALKRSAPKQRFGAPVADLEWPWDGGGDFEPAEAEPPREPEAWPVNQRTPGGNRMTKSV